MDIKRKIKQLKTIHWFFIVLIVANITLPYIFSSHDNHANESKVILFPPNIAPVILINSAEYEEHLARLEQNKKLVEEANRKLNAICYELGGFLEEDNIQEVEHILQKHQMYTERKTNQEKEIIGYWVYLEPERSRALGRLKVEEIKLKGLTDVVLLTHNNPRYAISLGFFKSKGFANKRLLKAQSLGLDAKMAARYKNQDYQWLVVKTNTENDLSQQQWLNILHDYENIELKTVDCQ